MNVLITLNEGLGEDLGPNFLLTCDVEGWSDIATDIELLAGVIVVVPDEATIIYIQSLGICLNILELPIEEFTTTTTTTIADEYQFLFDLYTNSPNSTTFDPVLYPTGTPTPEDWRWNLGDSTIEYGFGSSHTYVDSTLKHVQVYHKAPFWQEIDAIEMQNDHIVGELDLSMFDSFNTLFTTLMFQENSELTNIVFAPVTTGVIYLIHAYNCDLTGTFDLSMFNTFYDDLSQIHLYGNANLTDVTFSNSLTGAIEQLYINNCNLTGTLDLSMFDTFASDNARIQLYSNPLLTGVTFSPTITGVMQFVDINTCNLTGELDLSMFDTFNNLGVINASFNPLLTSITFPAALVSGTFDSIEASDCNITGALDLSIFDSFLAGSIGFSFNPLLTSVTFAPSVTGTILQILFAGCDLSTIDISMFTDFVNSGVNISLSSNTNLTSITMPTSTGKIYSFAAVNCDLSYIDFTNIPNALKVSGVVLNPVTIDLRGNSMTVTEVNHILVDLATLVSGEGAGGDYTNRIIDVSSNSIPDGSSGGYNGTAAIATLESKGITVNYDS